MPFKGTLDPQDSQRIYEFALYTNNSLPFIIILYNTQDKQCLIIYLLMRPLSPLRSPSPLSRPKITFNYPPSPLRERPGNFNAPPSPISTAKVPLPSDNGSSASIESIVFESQKCKHCQKIATHKQISEGARYCSNCAMQQIRKGTKIVRIQLKDQPFYKQFHQKIDKQNANNHSRRGSNLPNIYENENNLPGKQEHSSVKVQKLVKQAQQLKNELQNLMSKLQDKEFASEGIKTIYREKKLGLKNHYEKIKAAIKISIEKDLAELQKREKLSLQCLEDIKIDLNSGIHSLQKISNNLDPFYNTNGSTLEDRFEESLSIVTCMNDKKKTASQIVEQLSAFQHGQEANSDSLHVRLTQQQIQLAKGELYEPNIYTLLSGNPNKKQTLFSFERKQNL